MQPFTKAEFLGSCAIPRKQADIAKLQTQAGEGAGTAASQLRYLPVIARQDWVAVLNPKGEVVGYLQGDGF